MKIKNHDEKLEKKKVNLISFVSFLMGFSQAMLIYVMAYYFKIAAGTEDVGVFYFIAYGIILIILLNLHKIVEIRKIECFLFFHSGINCLRRASCFFQSFNLGNGALDAYIIFINLSCLRCYPGILFHGQHVRQNKRLASYCY